MRPYGAEFFGTFWLVLGGCGSAVLAAAFPGLGIGLLGVALAYAVWNRGGWDRLAWNVSLAWVSLVALYCWLRTPSFRLAPGLPTPVAWLAALAPVLIVLQLMPLPLFLLRALSPRRAELAVNLGAVMPVPAFAPLTIDAAATAAGVAAARRQ